MSAFIKDDILILRPDRQGMVDRGDVRATLVAMFAYRNSVLKVVLSTTEPYVQLSRQRVILRNRQMFPARS